MSDKLYFQNFSSQAAENIGILFPHYFYKDSCDSFNIPCDMSDEELQQMFSVSNDYHFSNRLKVPLELIDADKLKNYIKFIDNTSINFIGYCQTLDENILEIIDILCNSKITMRILYVFSCHNEINILDQMYIIKEIDALYQNMNEKNLQIRFKKIHKDLKIVKKFNKILIDNIKVRIKVCTTNFNSKVLVKTFNKSNVKNNIQYSLIFDLDIQQVKSKKYLIQVLPLNNVVYLGFYKSNKNNNNLIKIIIDFPIEYLALNCFTSPVKITFKSIKQIKLLNCGGKYFELSQSSDTVSIIDYLILKNTYHTKINKLLEKVTISATNILIADTIIEKEYYERVKDNIKSVMEIYSTIYNDSEEKILKMHSRNVMDFMSIKNLQSITFYNFPTLLLLLNNLSFGRDTKTVKFVNDYSYMVYESIMPEKILFSYTHFNLNSDYAYYINTHHYNLIKVIVETKNDSDSTAYLMCMNKCENMNVIVSLCCGIFSVLMGCIIQNYKEIPMNARIATSETTTNKYKQKINLLKRPKKYSK